MHDSVNEMSVAMTSGRKGTEKGGWNCEFQYRAGANIRISLKSIHLVRAEHSDPWLHDDVGFEVVWRCCREVRRVYVDSERENKSPASAKPER